LRQVAISYGSNAVPVMGGDTSSTRVRHQNVAVPSPGSGASLPTKTIVDEHIGCSGMTKLGEPCRARPANGTSWCAGHLRSRGEL